MHFTSSVATKTNLDRLLTDNISLRLSSTGCLRVSMDAVIKLIKVFFLNTLTFQEHYLILAEVRTLVFSKMERPVITNTRPELYLKCTDVIRNHRDKTLWHWGIIYWSMTECWAPFNF